MSPSPLVVCLGLSHETAPLALRERLSFGGDAQLDWYRRMREGVPAGERPEMLLLSTCNRSEWMLATVGDVAPVREWLLQRLASECGVAREELDPAFYVFTGEDVVRHLGRVAAGAESLVFGESEILGQIREALVRARNAGAAGPVLTAVVEHALRGGRRARHETTIGRHASSVPSEAIRAVGATVRLADSRIALLGGGSVARSIARLLRGHAGRPICVVTRRTTHGAELARAVGGVALAWHELPQAIADVDVVFCATAAPHALVTVELMASIRDSGSRPITIVDLCVPRNVEPEVGTLPGVTLIDLDDLQRRVGAHLDTRRAALPAVELVVEEECARFGEWLRHHRVRPLLGALHRRADEVRRAELADLLTRLPNLDLESRTAIEAFSEALVTRLLHEPRRRLRESSESASAARHLFGLGDGP